MKRTCRIEIIRYRRRVTLTEDESLNREPESRDLVPGQSSELATLEPADDDWPILKVAAPDPLRGRGLLVRLGELINRHSRTS